MLQVSKIKVGQESQQKSEKMVVKSVKIPILT